MQLRSYYRMIGFGVKVPFGASNGIEPYTFSIVPDLVTGAGGSIDSSGIYTAPQKEGVDTVRVEDANGDAATFRIGVGSPLKIVCDIIAKSMDLGADQVFIYNSKITPVKDSRLYIAISPLTSRTFSNSNKMIDGVENVSVNVFCPLDIMIYSTSKEAILRKEEVVMALNSNYSRQQQELNCIYVAPNTGAIVPISQNEGAAIPYAFNITANIQYVSRKYKVVDYYDSFSDHEIITNP